MSKFVYAEDATERLAVLEAELGASQATVVEALALEVAVSAGRDTVTRADVEQALERYRGAIAKRMRVRATPPDDDEAEAQRAGWARYAVWAEDRDRLLAGAAAAQLSRTKVYKALKLAVAEAITQLGEAEAHTSGYEFDASASALSAAWRAFEQRLKEDER